MSGCGQMAGVEMKKISLLAPNQDRAKLFREMQRHGCVQMIDVGGEEAHGNDREAELSRSTRRLDNCIEKLAPFEKRRRRRMPPKISAGQDQILSVLASRAELSDVVDRVEALEQEACAIQADAERIEAQLKALTPWEKLDVPLSRIHDTQCARIILLTISARSYDSLKAAANAAVVRKVGIEGDNLCVFIAVHASDAHRVDAAIERFSAVRVDLPDSSETPRRAVMRLEKEREALDERREAVKKELSGLADGLLFLRILRDVDANELLICRAQHKCTGTQTTFYMNGWVPSKMQGALQRALKRVSPACAIEFAFPAADEVPPTRIQVRKFSSPSQMIANLFSLPDPKVVDPALAMLPFWACFFCLSVLSAGYGAVIGALAGVLFALCRKLGATARLAVILFACELSAALLAVMHGGWIPEALTFAPLRHPLFIGATCLALGGMHAAFGYVRARAGGKDTLFQYARLYGMGIFAGLIGMGINLVAIRLMDSVFGAACAALIVIVGHVLNVGVNVLHAYAYGCGLQHDEFFSGFFGRGAEPFLPLREESKYIALYSADGDKGV